MADLVLVHSACPDALLGAAAAPFCVAGRPASPLPLLAVRQGGIRDEVQERAAAAGCAGWLGRPLVVFAELPALLAGELAPLSALERRTLLQAAARRLNGPLLGARRRRGVLDAVDRLFGDLCAERVAPAALRDRLAALAPDAWEEARDGELCALYDDYLAAIGRLPPLHGVPRSEGRDGLTRAAEAVREQPREVARRIRTPFGDADAARVVSVLGLNDLRRGWDHLVDALRDAPFVRELRVHLLLDDLDAGADGGEPLGEHALRDALLGRRPDRVERVAAAEDRPAALARVQRALLGASNDAVAHGDVRDALHAVAAPDLTRELETVARRVKQLIVGADGAAPVRPHRIAVVARKARPYGERAAELLRRHGVPVTTRLRANLAEVPAVAALLRALALADGRLDWARLGEVAESPYLDTGLDAALLRTIARRRRPMTAESWLHALRDARAEAALDANDDEARGPDVARATAAERAFDVFQLVLDGLLAQSRPRGGWIALALSCIGRDATGGQLPGDARDGLWRLCRNAYAAPHDERDEAAVHAARRDAAALDALAELLVGWSRALACADAAVDEVLEPAAWRAELLDALDDAEIALSTPHRRGVQVLEGSAAVWRTFDHVFLVGLGAGDFPADPPARHLFAEHEREALHEAGLPVEPATVWFAREASLFRSLANGARRSLHVSHAYAAEDGVPQLPSAYLDDVLSRVACTEDERAHWPATIPGSRVAPAALDDAWCADDAARFAARRWAERGDDAHARQALAAIGADAERRALVARVLRAASDGHDRRLLRGEPRTFRSTAVRKWNGAVTSPDLRDRLAARFGDAVWSASQLEAYGRCPFTFLVRHVLGVRPLDDADGEDEGMDGLRRGRLLHRALQLVHESLLATLGDDALTSAARKLAPRAIANAVERALAEMERSGEGEIPELRAYRAHDVGATVTRYLEWEIEQNEKGKHPAPPRRRPHACEVSFGMGGTPPVVLQRDGRVLKLRGRIDRVDVMLEGGAQGALYAVDHKTSKASCEPKLYEEGALLQLPLYLHAIARGAAGPVRAELPVWGGTYQVAGTKCARTATLHPRSLAKGQVREGGTKTEQDAAACVHGALDLALHHVDGIVAGEFPALLPRAMKGTCPPFCDARDVCREDRAGFGGRR